MTCELSDVLNRARQEAELSHGELWLRYFELGGMSTALQVEGLLYGVLRPSTNDYNVVAHALDERFVVLGGNHPVVHSEDGNDLPEEVDDP